MNATTELHSNQYARDVMSAGAKEATRPPGNENQVSEALGWLEKQIEVLSQHCAQLQQVLESVLRVTDKNDKDPGQPARQLVPLAYRITESVDALRRMSAFIDDLREMVSI